jgi:hypothetical protein
LAAAVSLGITMGAPGAAVGQAAVPADEYVPGQVYFGTNNYIEYWPGDLPLVFAAPHGGNLTPASIPVRTVERCGSDDFATVNDFNTRNLALEIRKEFHERTGMYPHIVINNLSRNRLDANRDVDMAACGNAEAERAWHEFHDFIEASKDSIEEGWGRGWFTDLHGHGHAIQRLELGYNLGAAVLRQSDEELDSNPAHEEASSFRVFSEASPLSFSELLRGPTSLGTLFENAGYPATPSQQDPAPQVGEAFFSGGFNTRLHGCSFGGNICGVQIEHNRQMRDQEDLPAYADAVYQVYREYLLTNFAMLVQSPRSFVDDVEAVLGELVADGRLSDQVAAGLLDRLVRAEGFLAAGREAPAIGLLEQFQARARNQIKGDADDAEVRDLLVTYAAALINWLAVQEENERAAA